MWLILICTSKAKNELMPCSVFSMTEAFIPKECAIKVFKTTLTDFKHRSKYVRGDIRFAKDEFKKQNPRRIIKIWAEKEDNNLRR